MLSHQHTSLFDSICDRKGTKWLAIIEDLNKHPIMGSTYQADKLWWAAKLWHDFPETIMTDSVENLCQVNERGIEILILFLEFFLGLLSCIYNVNCTTTFLKPHWLSGNRTCSRWARRQLSSRQASTSLAVERREIPKWLSQHCWFPFLLYRWTIVTSLKSCRTASEL